MIYMDWWRHYREVLFVLAKIVLGLLVLVMLAWMVWPYHGANK